MAMDSHDDDHYELLINDTVNNNHNEKSSNSSVGENDDTECGSPVSSHPVGTLSGSSRRKCCTLSKGITIEEFLETVDQNHQLTAIDKLILKNKAALAEDQMKRVGVKSKDKTTASQKKGDKNTKAKVLSSKIANSKHGKLDQVNGKSKSNMVKSKNSKTSLSTKVNVDKSKKVTKSFPKAEKTESRPSNPDLKTRTESRVVNGDNKNKAPKKQILETKGLRSNERASTNRKTLVQTARKSKKEPKINCKSFDMKRLKSNVAYRTRSVNNEKLRNGKTRIIRVLPDEKLPETKKKYSKPKDGTPSLSMLPLRDALKLLPDRNALKRPIKQEPKEEDDAPARKRKSSSLSVASSATNADKGNTSEKMDVDETSQSELTIKDEPHKEDNEIQVDISNVFEINGNVDVSSNELATKECRRKSKDVTPFSEDALVSNGLMIKNYCGAPDVKEESGILPVNDAREEGIQDDDTSENLNLQLDNLDDDMEEIEEVHPSSESAKVESTLGKTDEKTTDTKEPKSHLIANDSTRDSIFSALGLQSIERNGQKSKEKETKEEDYRGTLKMVIKTDKGCRRMEMKQACPSSSELAQNENLPSFDSKTIKNGNDRSTLVSSPTESSDSSGMSSLFVEDDSPDNDEVKNIISEVPTVITVEETTSIGNGDEVRKDVDKSGLDKSKGGSVSLVVPEKSSSFSIHPDRLCWDDCQYCFGKFGSLDTPCHLGQLKNLERQKTILSSEPNLQIDTCLCDACFRFVDRKNRPSNKRKAIRPSSLGQREIICAVQNCNQPATKLYSKRKWRSKICRKFANLSFDMQRKNNGSGLGLCSQHFNTLDLYTLCGICKKRLNRNEMYSVRTEVNELNVILVEDGIPVKLMDNMLLCKYCHHCTSLRLNLGDPSQMSKSNKDYYESFRKEVLRYRRVDNGQSEEKKNCESQKTEITGTFVSEETNSKTKDHPLPNTSTSLPIKQEDSSATTSNTKNRNVDMEGIANLLKPLEGEKSSESKMNHTVGLKDIASLLKPLEGEHSNEKNSTHIQLKFGNLNIGKLSNLNIGQNTQSLPVQEKKNEHPPGDGELPLMADFSFDDDDDSSRWVRCESIIQFDKSTKKLWEDLQKPYGNPSSFLRHLVMLEKYWRNGALVLSNSADSGVVKYINSVKNRVESLEYSSAPKLPPVPALAPASAPAPAPPTPTPTPAPPPPPPHNSQKPIVVKCEKLTPPPPLQPAPRPPQPPPLLKLNCLTPFFTRRTPVCTVRPSAECTIRTVRTSLPAPPKLERIPSMYLNTKKSTPVASNRSMVQTQIRSKPQIIQIDTNGRAQTVPVLRKSPALTNGTGNAVRTFPSYYATKPATNMNVNLTPPSMLISKLPKALTVTQIDDIVTKDRKEIKPPQIAAPFLTGEKPSVSVFREVTK